MQEWATRSAEQASEFLQQLFAYAPADLWALLWTLPDKRSLWFLVGNYSDMAEAAIALAADHDVYIGVSLFARDLGPHSRGKLDDAAGIVGLWADIDVASPAHKKPNLPPDMEAAGFLLQAVGPKPTMLVHTGHGLHAWWLFREPWIFDSDAERKRAASFSRRWQQTLRTLARHHGWDLDATHDLTRVLRIPGTFNHKRLTR